MLMIPLRSQTKLNVSRSVDTENKDFVSDQGPMEVLELKSVRAIYKL